MKITRHYPGYVDTVTSKDPETAEFLTKEELLEIPFVKTWMKLGKNAHLEITFEKSIVLKENFCYLMWVFDNLKAWYVVGTVRKCSDSDIEILKTWFPEWKYEKMNNGDSYESA